MNNKKISKFDEKYLKRNYVTEFKIDDKNKKVNVYYIDGESYSFPLTASVLSVIKSNMKTQYYEWSDLIKRVYVLHPIKLLYLNVSLKKQKFYLEHESELNSYSIKNNLSLYKLSNREKEIMDTEKRYTHSFFNLSSVTHYKLSTMKKVHKIISVYSKQKNQKKTNR